MINTSDSAEPRETLATLLFYLVTGVALGVLFIKGEVVSWFRIQEMFRLQSIHMYGTIGSAVAVGALSIRIIKWTGVRSLAGEPITFKPKDGTPRFTRYWLGGILFGLGWALLGACPGPMFTLVGGGEWAFGVAILAAVVGTRTYALLRPRLPH